MAGQPVRSRPTLASRWLFAAASLLAPRRARAEWRRRWGSGLRAWWLLVERGELAGGSLAAFAGCFKAACADAFALRCHGFSFAQWVRGPSFLAVCAVVLLLATVLLSGGLPVTRRLIGTARGLSHLSPHGEGFLLAHAVPITFAFMAGTAVAVLGPLPLRRYGWRFRAMLVFKTAFLMVWLPVLWIESGAALRAHMAGQAVRALGGGLLYALVFVAAFGAALAWSMDDQRRRCPVCLRRLALPVALGSWGSVFEPAATELLCEEGHGSLWVSETETGAPDRWMALDASWRTLFGPVQTGNDSSAPTRV